MSREKWNELLGISYDIHRDMTHEDFLLSHGISIDDLSKEDWDCYLDSIFLDMGVSFIRDYKLKQIEI